MLFITSWIAISGPGRRLSPFPSACPTGSGATG